jgi:protocatechuate 3,4-dioxygenase beta subunit
MTAPDVASEVVVTPEQIEGPYWLPGSPERRRLSEGDTRGEPLTLTGRVLFRDGEPVPGAWLDFWQCDGEGVYDIDGYALRGHQITDAEGGYRLETVVPVEYIDVMEFRGRKSNVHRTSHIHAKIKLRGKQTLTTQLYFPDEPYNTQDRLFRAECLVELGRDANGKLARFDFILPW